VLKADLDGVLESLVAFSKSKIWLEITTLLIPEVNDSSQEIEKMAEFIVTKLGKDTPWHLSAFHPDYKMNDTPPTSMATMQRAKEIAKSFAIKYVYLGNVLDDGSTYCPKCQTKLVSRNGYKAKILNLKDSTCTNCGEVIEGVWR
jgi:pyruvate formate lyase activating enzyme